MLSRNEEGGIISLRAHRMFLDAPEEVVRALACWAQGKTKGGELIQEYIDRNTDRVRKQESGARRRRIVTRGRYYDLAEMAARLNEVYLQGRSRALVTWGRRITHLSAHRIRLGCYDPVTNTITMSQRLDRREIPHYMVEYVLFHEMLHEVLGIGARPDGKRDIHGKMFRLMEQTYPHYERALAYERRKWGGEG